ncbi:hypothetical protein EB093_00855 [bacterium]|nr:hypothetical protein [bacterium]
MIQVVSDIDFTISVPQKTQVPFNARCLASGSEQCPIFEFENRFPCEQGRCVPRGDSEFHRSMGCAHRDAFSEEFYTWLASLDVDRDEPIQSTIDFIRSFERPAILLTNRDEQCREKTIQFMNHHQVPFTQLRMRATGDLRPLWEFKLEQMADLAAVYTKIIWLDDQRPPITFPNVEWRHPDSLNH